MIHPKNHYVSLSLALLGLFALPLHAKDIVIPTSSMTLTSVPYLVAIEKRFFEKEGLTAQYVVMRSDLAVKGLITGDVDYNQKHIQRSASVPFGWGTKPLLDSMRITHRSVEKTQDVGGAISNAVKSMNSMQAPVAILFAGEILF